jgi:hypothetical protein
MITATAKIEPPTPTNYIYLEKELKKSNSEIREQVKELINETRAERKARENRGFLSKLFSLKK